MYVLEYEGKIATFGNEEDYLQRLDYVENGLKFTKVDCTNAYCFNDGGRSYMIKMVLDNSILPVLHKGSRTIKDKRQTRKYAEIIERLQQ